MNGSSYLPFAAGPGPGPHGGFARAPPETLLLLRGAGRVKLLLDRDYLLYLRLVSDVLVLLLLDVSQDLPQRLPFRTSTSKDDGLGNGDQNGNQVLSRRFDWTLG